MGVLLNLERLILSLQLNANINVKCRSLISSLVVVCILHIATSPLAIELNIYISSNKLCIQILHTVETTRAVNHRTSLARSVYHKEWSNTRSLCYAVVISTKCWRNVNDTSTIGCGYIVTHNHTERITILLHRLYPWNKLLITDTLKLLTCVVLVSYSKLTLHLLAEECWYKLSSHDDCLTLVSIWVVALNLYVVDIWANAECSV